MQRIWQVITVTLAALLLGTSFAHGLEWPAKLPYDGDLYVRLQTSLYSLWGPPHVGGFLEPVTIFAVLILAVLVRSHRSALRLPLVAAGCLLLAFPVVFFWRVAPANAAFLSAAATDILPPDWSMWRPQWETVTSSTSRAIDPRPEPLTQNGQTHGVTRVATSHVRSFCR